MPLYLPINSAVDGHCSSLGLHRVIPKGQSLLSLQWMVLVKVVTGVLTVRMTCSQSQHDAQKRSDWGKRLGDIVGLKLIAEYQIASQVGSSDMHSSPLWQSGLCLHNTFCAACYLSGL